MTKLNEMSEEEESQGNQKGRIIRKIWGRRIQEESLNVPQISPTIHQTRNVKVQREQLLSDNFMDYTTNPDRFEDIRKESTAKATTEQVASRIRIINKWSEGRKKPIKIYECSSCQKGFKHRRSAWLHIRRVEFGELKVCINCDRQFANNYNLKNHQKACPK